MLPALLFAAPPVITVTSPELHHYFVPEESSGTQFGYAIVASNAPTSFDASGLPPTAAINRSSGVISGGLETPGVFPLTLSATNADGTGTAPLRLMIHPAFVGITTSRGEFVAGQRVTISLTCNRPVFVTGQPAVTFSGSTAPRAATYLSGSGSSTLVFGYTVQPGETTNGRPIQIETLDTTAGAIRDADGLDPSPRLPVRYFSSGVTFAAAPVTPVTISAATVNGTVGLDFRFVVSRTGNPTTFAATGLPPGLTINNAGIIAGVPTAAGNFTVNVTASNATGATGRGVIGIVLAAAATPRPPTVAPTTPVAPTLPSVPTQPPVTTPTPPPTATPPPVNVPSSPAGTPPSVPPAATPLSPPGVQTIDFTLPVSSIVIGQPIRLGATASSGLPVTFSIVSGPASIDGNMLTVTSAGAVVVRAVQAGNDAFAAAEMTSTITVPPGSRLLNLSSRVRVQDAVAGGSFIAGFVVSGTEPKPILVRAVGPTLAEFGVQASLANPRLRVLDANGRVLGENDDWAGPETVAASARVGAFALGAGGRDAAMLVTLAPGSYSLQVDGNGREGIALAEIYDASVGAASEPIINLSTRGYVGTGEGALTAGFVVAGSGPKRLLIRGIGPGLTAFNVADALKDPVLRLHADNAVIAQNDDWGTPQPANSAEAATGPELVAAFAGTGAFALSSGSKDAAMIVTLPPGAYTAIVSGAGNTTGAGLVEVYELPPASR